MWRLGHGSESGIERGGVAITLSHRLGNRPSLCAGGKVGGGVNRGKPCVTRRACQDLQQEDWISGVPKTNKNSYIVRLGSWRMVVGWGKWYPLGLIHPVCGFLIKCLSGETVDAELPARFEGSHIKRENK